MLSSPDPSENRNHKISNQLIHLFVPTGWPRACPEAPVLCTILDGRSPVANAARVAGSRVRSAPARCLSLTNVSFQSTQHARRAFPKRKTSVEAACRVKEKRVPGSPHGGRGSQSSNRSVPVEVAGKGYPDTGAQWVGGRSTGRQCRLTVSVGPIDPARSRAPSPSKYPSQITTAKAGSLRTYAKPGFQAPLWENRKITDAISKPKESFNFYCF